VEHNTTIPGREGGPGAGAKPGIFLRDPAFIASTVPLIDGALSWFDAKVRGVDDLPAEGPFLMVGNHCGGMYMPDAFALMVEWYRRRAADREMYALVYDLVFEIPGLASAMRRLGGVPASHENARRALDRGAGVMVYPGGDEDAYRPWVDRHHIDLHGHKGFVKLALRSGVPVYPVVSHGSHDSIVVLLRGGRIARTLGLRRLRVNVFPIMAGLPWGIAPVWMPMVPLPSKITVQVCEPFDWSHYGPGAAEDDDIVEHCYEEILGRMQASLDELVTETPYPVIARVRDALIPWGR